jgi:hypothetical protein
MPVNILRTAVGIRSIEHLEQVQKPRIFDWQGQPATWTTTRNFPTRDNEITGGQGSLYWIVQRLISVRQPILDLVRERDEEGRAFCRMILSADLTRTVPVERKPMQGWRYMDPADAPKDYDAVSASGDQLPPEMLAELKQLGLM